jgi:hypothetical protein
MRPEHRKPTQARQILALLRERGPAGLTPLEALAEVGCFRLASRVHELVHEHGHEIETQALTLPNGKRIARYVLHEAPQRALGL